MAKTCARGASAAPCANTSKTTTAPSPTTPMPSAAIPRIPASTRPAARSTRGRGVLELQDFTATATGLTTIAAGDLNDDGKIDILANAGPTQPTPTTYWLFANETKQVCGFSVTPNNILLPTSGVATEQLVVKASSKCSWQALSHSPWISIQSGGTGTGNGTVMLS